MQCDKYYYTGSNQKMKLDFSSVDIAVEMAIARHEYLFKLEMLFREPLGQFPQPIIRFARAMQLEHQFKQKIFALGTKKEKIYAVHETRENNPLITGKTLEDILNGGETQVS